MADKYDYDLVIVGAGSAGITGATFAAQVGARVALVEQARVGGDCTWTGCIPSKALIHVAKVAYAVQRASQYGIGALPTPSASTASPQPATDMSKVRDFLNRAIGDVYSMETPEVLRARGIDVVQAPASFLDPHTLRAGARTLTGKAFLLCTGAGPTLPQALGLDGVPYLTYEHFFANSILPEHLIVVGGGPVGLELAQAYRRIGAHVTLVASRLLPREEPKVALLLEKVLAREGVARAHGRATAFKMSEGAITVEVGEGEVSGDLLLIATGRAPNVSGLDLEKAGVSYSDRGIQVNEHLQTSAAHVYAAGDCTGGYQFTHYAGWQGFQAVRNALFVGSSIGISEIVPRTTYTDPEIAQVGYTEAGARRKFGAEVAVTVRSMDTVDRAICEDSTDGFIKTIYKKDGTLLGATVAAARAGEVITEYTLALTRGMKSGEVAGAIHPYPTYSTPVQQITAEIAAANFLESLPGKVVRRLSGLPTEGDASSLSS